MTVCDCFKIIETFIETFAFYSKLFGISKQNLARLIIGLDPIMACYNIQSHLQLRPPLLSVPLPLAANCMSPRTNLHANDPLLSVHPPNAASVQQILSQITIKFPLSGHFLTSSRPHSKGGRALSPFFGPPQKPKYESYRTTISSRCFIS